MTTSASVIRIGDVIELDVDKVANGGFCIARHDGKVVFVRHTLPGERVLATVTEITSKFLRADATEILVASPHRVLPPCSVAGLCGGCDWQHVELAYQRELKSQIVREQLSHLAKIEKVNGEPISAFAVQPLSQNESGLRWRTRNRFVRTGPDSVGMRMSRSHTAIEISDCLIAVDGAVSLAEQGLHLGADEVSTAMSSTGEHVVGDPRGGPWLTERVLDRSWRIHASSFWQVHREAPERLVRTVRDFAGLKSGERLLDLYCGSGLFAASLARDVGENGTVVGVESSVDAVRNARRSCSDLGNLELITADVNKWVLSNRELFDVVVLDPPRAGAGGVAVEAVSKTAQRAIIYVACEPSSLGRDTAYFAQQGWSLTKLVGFDAFPMTAHVECIALFEKS